MVAIVGLYTILTHCRNRLWNSEILLWSDAIAKAPTKGRPYSARGAAYMQQGQYAEAMADLNRAIELSGLPIAHSNRGSLRESMGDVAGALADYDKAIELNPRFADAWYNRGTCHLRLGRLEEAVTDLTRAIELDHRRPETWVNRGAAHLKLGQLSEAISDLDRGLELAPDHAGAYLNRALAHGLDGNPDKARADAAVCRMLGGDTRELERLLRSSGAEQGNVSNRPVEAGTEGQMEAETRTDGNVTKP